MSCTIPDGGRNMEIGRSVVLAKYQVDQTAEALLVAAAGDLVL
jgi:hypothetical protein